MRRFQIFRIELINKIKSHCNELPDAVNETIIHLKKNQFNSIAKHHDYYKNNFNCVDLHDKR